MASSSSASDVIKLLKDIEQRSQHGGARLYQQGQQQLVWTAIDFTLAHTQYLIPLAETREVFPVPTHLTPVPLAKPWVLGIANLRGELLPIFDLKHFLYGKASKLNKHSRVIVINKAGLYSSVLVDGVTGLKHFQTQPQSTIFSDDPTLKRYLNGSIDQKNNRWDVFSFQKLASDPRFLNAAI